MCKDQKYYDVSDVFWTKQNPSRLAKIFQTTNEKREKSCSSTNRLASYIKRNKKIT